MIKHNKVPYRFTCDIPCEVVGEVSALKTQEEGNEMDKETEELIRHFNLEEEFGVEKNSNESVG